MTADEQAQAYLPMSETAFYILLSLTTPRHGYGIMQYVEQLTAGRVCLGAGTLYGSLSKMERDGLIYLTDETNKRKSYIITPFGKQVLLHEKARITELYMNAKEVLGQ